MTATRTEGRLWSWLALWVALIGSPACGGAGVAAGQDAGSTDADGDGSAPDADEADVAEASPDVEVHETDVDGEGETSGDDGADGAGDAFVLDAHGWEASEYVVHPGIGGCGDYVVDPGEECDDGNRLNGDGCDWLCRIGDGDPPPEPDPGAPHYEPSGDPALLPAGLSLRPPTRG